MKMHRGTESISNRLSRGRFTGRSWIFAPLCVALIACATAMPGLLLADSPSGPDSLTGRAARLSNVEGGVQLLNGAGSDFQQALQNMPLIEGSRLVTSGDGRAEIQFEDGSIARITPNSSLSLNVLRHNSDGSVVTEVELLSGLGYFELKPAAGQQLDAVRFGANLLTATSNAVLRINRDTEPAEVAVLAGDAHIAGGTLFNVDVHANETIRFDATDPSRYYLGQNTEGDSWDQWNSDRDQALMQAAAQESAVAADHGDPDNPAWGDLDSSGSWYSVPGYGNVWTPAGVGAGWDPYGSGYWALYPGYGYTWISGYSWGWLPYRCGGWNYFSSFGWGWMPGNCGFGFGGGGYGGGWGGGIVIYSGPRGYLPPPRPILKGPVARLGSNQRVIPVDRGVVARTISPNSISGGNNPPRPIVYAGQNIEPISAKFNRGAGDVRGTALRGNTENTMEPRAGEPTRSPGANQPWFGSGNGAARSGAHPVPTEPGGTYHPGRPAGGSYQPPAWSTPPRPAGGSSGSSGAPPAYRPPPPPSAPHYNAPPAPASHPSPAPAPAATGHPK